MGAQGEERRRARLYRRGGSLSVTVPKAWLEGMDLADDVVELVHVGNTVVIEAPVVPSIKDEPEFAAFLHFISKESLARPERLPNALDVMGDDDALFAGVNPDL
jgi:antitoxin component of MazEF toxin-antitoxin module